jgi:agmatinase
MQTLSEHAGADHRTKSEKTMLLAAHSAVGQRRRRPIGLLGIPSDSNSSFLRGTARAPDVVRKALSNVHGNAAAENGLEIGREIRVVDHGDVRIEENATDDDRISACIRSIIAAGELPLSIGGDHWVTAPIVRSLAEVHGPINILHIDAHPDLYDELDGNRRSHASPFARILEAGAAARLVQVGVRTVNAHQRAQTERFGIIEQISPRQLPHVTRPILQAPLYISIDLDGIDPAAAPGVSHHEPGGLTVREVLDLLDAQTAHLVGADVVEFNPSQDQGDITAVLIVKLIREIAAMTGAA